MQRRSAIVLVVVQLYATLARSAEVAKVTQSGSDYTLTNGYASVTFSPESGAITSLKGDFEGEGNYGEELLAATGFSLSAYGPDGHELAAGTEAATVQIVSRGPATAAIAVTGIEKGSASESWVLTLHASARGFELNITGTMTADALAGTIVHHSLLATPLAVYGYYPDDGVVQMMNAKKGKNFMPSARPLQRVYMMGGVNPSNTNPKPPDSTQGAIDITRSSSFPGQVTMLSSNPDSLLGRLEHVATGFFEVVAGNMTGGLDAWGKGLSGPDTTDAAATTIVAGTSWKSSMIISPNNKNFPASNLTIGSNIPTDDLNAVMTGIYGSAPGCLCTFPNSPACPGMEGKHVKLGQIATTIARPDRGYGGTYNYFDPDNFISMTALIYSGEPFLQEQARTVIERSGSWLCIGEVEKNNTCTYGQLPHHFVGTKPTFLALSGATQTGPNTFWTKAALQYARNSGNLAWLKSYMPTLRASSAFCFDLINKTNHLLLAPGSLMVDVFVRQNYTADSNAMMVGFLNEFADAEEAVGNTTGATALRAEATAMSMAMDAIMWDTDHFVTQVNPEPGPAGPRGISTDGMDCAKAHNCRDFVDYDSNVIAVAHGVGGSAKAKATLARIDRGKAVSSSAPVQKCSAMQGGGPQWTSEIWYGPGDTTGFPHGNIGDSCSAMGRIAYYDARARKMSNDPAPFETQLSVLQKDLLFYTWMHERYGCDGKMQTNRTAAYFEYPSIVAILQREIRYGIEIDFAHVTVNPLMSKPGPFSYHIGNVNVDYKPRNVTTVDVPAPTGVLKEHRLHGMVPSGEYTISASGSCAQSVELTAATATAAGLLTFAVDGSCAGGVRVAFRG